MSVPWLSVIVPTYNGEAFLANALSSILAQRDDRIEVIAVDDGSSDATISILKSFTTKLSLRIVIRDHVGNWVANTNYGLSLAGGDFICFLHQDDHWLPDRIRLLKPLVGQSGSTAMLLHPSWFIDSGGERVGLWRCPLPGNRDGLEPEIVLERLLVQNFISIPAPLFSRELAIRVGGLDEKLWYTADWDFWLKLAAAGKSTYIPQVLSAFRIHGRSQTMQRGMQIDDFRRQLAIVLDRHLIKYEESHGGITPAVRQAASFSVNVNTMLASNVHGQKRDVLSLVPKLLGLGPEGCYRFLRDSRILERTFSRIRAGMIDHRHLATNLK